MVTVLVEALLEITQYVSRFFPCSVYLHSECIQVRKSRFSSYGSLVELVLIRLLLVCQSSDFNPPI